jgi:hypothetical protein
MPPDAHRGGNADEEAESRPGQPGDTEPEGQGPPWPLTRAEIDGFRRAGLEEVSFEDYADAEPPWTRRFRALYRRPGLPA